MQYVPLSFISTSSVKGSVAKWNKNAVNEKNEKEKKEKKKNGRNNWRESADRRKKSSDDEKRKKHAEEASKGKLNRERGRRLSLSLKLKG